MKQNDRQIRLGHLEVEVLEWLWSRDWGDVKSAHAEVSRPRTLSRNTLHSTLERLVRKGLAERERCGRAYLYRALITREAWVRESVARNLQDIPGADPELLLAGFVDFAERVDENGLIELERRVRARRRARDAERNGDDS